MKQYDYAIVNPHNIAQLDEMGRGGYRVVPGINVSGLDSEGRPTPGVLMERESDL